MEAVACPYIEQTVGRDELQSYRSRRFTLLLTHASGAPELPYERVDARAPAKKPLYKAKPSIGLEPMTPSVLAARCGARLRALLGDGGGGHIVAGEHHEPQVQDVVLELRQ